MTGVAETILYFHIRNTHLYHMQLELYVLYRLVAKMARSHFSTSQIAPIMA